MINPFSIIVKAFRNGDCYTRISFFIMGVSCLVRKQIIKGCIYLISELSFLWYMITFGITAFSNSKTLGSVKQQMHMDPETNLPVKVQGDNSMLMLLAFVLACIILVFFVVIWYSNIKDAYQVQRLASSHKKIPSFKEEMRDYLDKKVHKTLLFLPCLGILIFNIIPLFFMILIAFTNFDSRHQPPGHLFTWVGISNFKQMLGTGNIIGRTFWPVLAWTIIWAIFATFLNYILGMILALLINRKETKGKRIFRMIFVMSVAVPQFVSLLIMRSMLAKDGPINLLLMTSGITDGPIMFLENPLLAKITVIVVNLWVGIPYTMLITTGILQNIPAELYESAKIDGANSTRIFFKITLPYMLFVTAPYLITQFVGNLNNFNVIYFLTGGEPLTLDYYQAGHTDLLVTWLYKLTANSFDYSYAAVVGIIIFILSAVISILTYRRTKSYRDEEGFQN